MDLVLKTIFFPVLDEDDVTDEQIADPFTKIFEQFQLDAALAKGGQELDWDEPLTDDASRFSGTAGKAVTFAKGTLGHKLGIARCEQKEIEGDRWLCGYNSAGDLVDVRILEGHEY